MSPQALGQLLWLALIVAGMYFLFIRPQMKRQKEHQALMSSLEIGDRVVTIGGMYGSISSLEDDKLGLEIASGVTVEVARSAIARKLTSDTTE